jgi:uncharacterized membrane protein HdeD (DUF308 family)
MTESTPVADQATPPPDPAAASGDESTKPVKPGFAFTDPGCRTEIRLGALMILIGVFMWGWLGPTWASPVAYLGVPLVLVGVVLQVRDSRRSGRPGYPWKLGIAMGIGGLVMLPDLLYRERFDAALLPQITVLLLIIPGLWILGWWPAARRRPQEANA